MPLKTRCGVEIPYDRLGNNIALECPCCKYPVLIPYGAPQNIRRDQNNPAVCRKCMSQYWVEQVDDDDFILHRP